jgi:DNA repair exonuclease SbcCD ATPase subunit
MNCLDDVFQADSIEDSVEDLPPAVSSPVNSEEEADTVSKAVVASQAVVTVPAGSRSPSIRLGRVDRVPNATERRRLVGQFSDILDGVAVSGVTQVQLARMEAERWQERALEAEAKVEQLEADKSALGRKLMLEQVSTQTAASQGAQHKADWEDAMARVEKAERKLAEIKAKILVPTPKTATQLTKERNVATINAHLVVSLREQLGELAAEKYELEKQLEEARASNTQKVPRTEPGSETEPRLVPLTVLIKANSMPWP